MTSEARIRQRLEELKPVYAAWDALVAAEVARKAGKLVQKAIQEQIKRVHPCR